MIYNEHTELALSTIFAKVCEIGNPDRKTVKDVADFMLKASSLHHNSPIYADIYENKIEFDKGKKRYVPTKIDKLFFDFDHEKQSVVESDINLVIERLKERGIPEKDMIKVWTTGKGDHLYCRLKPLINPTKEEVMEYQQKMKAIQFAVSQCYCNDKPHLLHSVDTKVFAEFSRIARVPGIQRFDNKMFPTVVHLTKPLKLWVNEHKGWDNLINAGTEILKNWGWGSKHLDDIFRKDDEQYVIRYTEGKIKNLGTITIQPILSKPSGDYTDWLISTFKSAGFSQHLIDRTLEKTADNDTRVASATKLLEAGKSPDIIANIFAMIGWYNYDYYKTREYLTTLLDWKLNKQHFQD